MEKLATMLMRLRLQKGMTIRELAKETDLSERFISYLEKGDYKPSLKTVFKLSKALEINPEEIFQHLATFENKDKDSIS